MIIGSATANIDDNLKKADDANDAAAVANNGVKDINSDNKLTPNEKLSLKRLYDSDVLKHDFDVKQLTSMSLPTADIDLALSNLTSFTAKYFVNMDITEEVDRQALNKVFNNFENADKAVEGLFNDAVQQVADDAKTAGEEAKEAGEKAQEAGEEAKASADQAKTDATQAKADAATAQQKAQSSIDQFNAHLPDIDKALSTANLVKQDVTKLSSTTEQYHNEYTTGIKNVIKTIDDTSTEIDQINNEIKLKANSSDVTSQISVAISGIQNTVNNKADKSQITQLANQITSVVSDIDEGKTNLIVNGGFENGTDNWIFENVSNWSINKSNGYQPFTEDYIRITPDGKGYITQKLVRFNGLSVSDWNFNFYYNIQNNVSGYVKAYLRIDYEDGTVKYINDTNLTANNNAWQRMSVKINKTDLSAVTGIALRLQFIGASGGGNVYFSQFQISRGADDKPYTKSNLDNVNQSQITQLKNDVNLRVSKNDVVNQINISNEGILIDGKKVHITGNTSIDNAVIKNAMIANAAINTAQIADGAINNAKIANASIDDAKISNLNGNKIIARSITSQQLNADDIIANVINGKTINGITINTPNLQLGTNGILSEDWSLNQATSLFNPKKGSGTMTLTKGILATSGTLSRWWSDDGGYWYGIGDDGSKIKDGSNQVGDNYGAGYVQHNIFDSKGNTLLRTYMDATGLYMNSGGTSSVNTVLTQQGLTTTNVNALGDINGATLTTSSWVEAGIGSGNGIRIGFRTIQSHNTQDLYFNGDDNKQSVTLHAKSIIQSSQLSRKKDIKPLDPDYAMKVIRNSDMYGYRYNEESPTEPFHYSGIIDDVNGIPQFKMPEEFISEDRTGRNDGNTVAFLVEALKQADKRIGILEGMMNRD